MTVEVELVEQHSHLLGRQRVHDSDSRGFAMPTGAIDRSTWFSRSIRVYDPVPNPLQDIGCCTGCSKCSQFNSAGNRRSGVVLGLPTAKKWYSNNTKIDPFPGQYLPTDTGSSGLASCQTSVQFGEGGEYRWLFGGADEVVQNIMAGRVISVGTWWYEAMFEKDASGRIKVAGDRAGGHQYVFRGYDKSRDWLMGRCWWGEFRDFWISRTEADTLLRDGGDAHWQVRT